MRARGAGELVLAPFAREAARGRAALEGDRVARVGPAQERAIERGEALRLHLAPESLRDVALAPLTELSCRELLAADAETPLDVFP